MARNRRGNSQRIETSVELVKVVAHTKENKTVYRGIIKHKDKEYYFTANKHCMPIVLGAKDFSIMKETAKALNNWYKDSKRPGTLYKDIEDLFKKAEAKAYIKEISKGIFMVKRKEGYFGYLPGAAGIRAVTMNLKDMKPMSCTFNKNQGWTKLVDDNDAKPFRQMASQGQKIKEIMIPEFKRVIAALEEQNKNNKPDPDGPGPNRTKEETKPEIQIEKETQQTQEEPQRTTRRRRRTTVIENNQEQPTVKKSEIVICYCGSCNCDTEQERVNKYEVMCKECGSQWEYFEDEEETQETVIETPQEETVIETVQEEMEQAMNEEMKKVEEQVREEIEQRSTRRKRTRRTQEEVPQVTNEDMHGKETNEESTVVRQDNGAEEIPSNTNDVSNISTNEKAINNDDYDWNHEDIECDNINPDEAGDSFEVEAGILW